MAIVTLAVPGARRSPRSPGPGFLVPPVDGRAVKASTFSFAKWDWVREAGADAGGRVVLRCSLGRHREEQTLQRSDEELVELALADLADAIGLLRAPVDTHVQRWGGALPQYAVGHLDRVASVRARAGRAPGSGGLRLGVRRRRDPGLHRLGARWPPPRSRRPCH